MAEETRRGLCLRAGTGEPLPAAGGRLLVGGEVSAGSLTVVQSRAPAGDQVPLHVHHEVDECFYVLGGHYAVTCGDDQFDARPGDLVYLPAGVPHAYQVGDRPAEKLIIAVPAGLEAFFRDLGRDGVDLDELQHRHGISFL